MKQKPKFMSFEHKKKTLQPYPEFMRRLLRYFMIAFMLILFSVAIGCLGYHYLGNLNWIDAFHNACMILTGMGPVAEMQSNTAKFFSSFYALYSGIAFLSTIVIFFAPVIHRIMHVFHIEENDKST
jgi:hypothetical protein